MNASFFTISARNYLGYALTLRESVLSVYPEARFYIFLSDHDLQGDAPAADIIPASQLSLPDHDDMAFRYTVMEFATAIKPFCFHYLFRQGVHRAAIYLDPDMFMLGDVDDILESLDGKASCVLTPHLLAPLPDDGKSPDDLDILRSGIFNLGFAAFANNDEANDFLDWWARQCAQSCFNDLSRGLFVDQKFVDMAPAFLSKLEINRRKGVNAAYWNLIHRPITRGEDGDYRAGGEALSLFHFSGVVPDDASVFSKHQDRFGTENIGALTMLLDHYRARLHANNTLQWLKQPYGYGTFPDGEPIPPAARRIYADRIAAGEEAPPFVEDYGYLNGSPDSSGGALGADRITRLMQAVWDMRSDLQSRFPLSTGRGRRQFRRWFIFHAESEGLSNRPLTAPARAGLYGPVMDQARALYRKIRKLPNKR